LKWLVTGVWVSSELDGTGAAESIRATLSPERLDSPEVWDSPERFDSPEVWDSPLARTQPTIPPPTTTTSTLFTQYVPSRCICLAQSYSRLNHAISASISSISFGTSLVSISTPVAVIATSSSILTPIPLKRSGTSQSLLI